MCGTPVVTMRLGAVGELVDDGITGFLAASHQEFVEQIHKSFLLNRSQIRRVAEARFTARRMAEQYVQLFEQVQRYRCSAESPIL